MSRRDAKPENVAQARRRRVERQLDRALRRMLR
ncbi:MAG: hypothetical protein JWM10_2741, partial [Myxococcaceae bacterium]|nr:hypothetical protein [Myxococcaceae bacterium]